MPCIRCNASLVVVVYAGEWNFWTRKRTLKGVGTCWLVGIDKVFFRLLCFFINIFKQKLPLRKSSFKIDKKLHIKIQILFCIKLLYRERNKFPWKFSPLSSHLCSKLALCKKHMSHDNKINWAFKPEKHLAAFQYHKIVIEFWKPLIVKILGSIITLVNSCRFHSNMQIAINWKRKMTLRVI